MSNLSKLNYEFSLLYEIVTMQAIDREDSVGKERWYGTSNKKHCGNENRNE